ncbi:MAG: Ribosomal protein S12 methylthiotransferase RimO [Candidatus Aerophobetes bacterium ADurb.Bin490]|nr:MAG: Ribosomal protein S12 methylthiotransferase RimO [Candidatus Aerophobetes bacterium ADurb.Bin490]HRQ42818.1 30S ribosomal protein S12 methylthiotransferase RimO [Candidatus Goldiibacteriota bacterium]
MKLGVISLGCPKNTVDTECMLSCLDSALLTTNPSDADVILINTCAFLKSARDESAGAINEMLLLKEKNPALKIVVAGCFVSKDLKTLKEKFKGVNAWVGVNNISDIKTAIEKGGEFVNEKPFIYKSSGHTALLNPYSAYVKISEGCNHKCSFCAIPSIKGKYRSRAIQDIASETAAMAGAGIKEINLISQDLVYYGTDIYGEKKLDLLMSSILKKTKKYFWLRLLYLYPDLSLIKRIVKVMKSDERVCPYIDIPFQHVSDNILKSMRRGYRKKDILEITAYLKEQVPGITIRSGFITGYPGETKADFEELREFIKQGHIDRAGFFAYSDEPGTHAYTLKGKHTIKECETRRGILMLDSAENYAYNKNSAKGKTIKVLIAGMKNSTTYAARTQGNAPDIDSYVLVKASKKLDAGSFCNVKITGVQGYDLKGEICR